MAVRKVKKIGFGRGMRGSVRIGRTRTRRY